MLRDTKQDKRLLEAIAEMNECFIDFTLFLRRRSEVLSVKRNLDCRKSENEVILECYSDAELFNGNAVCWWLEFRQSTENWRLATSVVLNDEKGQDILKEFPERVSTSLEEFIIHLREATRELLEIIPSTIFKM